MSMFTLPDSWKRLHPIHDDRIAYEAAMQEAERQARILAFEAIRRAAEVARQFDHDAEMLRQRCHAIVDGKDSGDVALLNRYQSESKINAAIVRRAIRAASGSDKR